MHIFQQGQSLLPINKHLLCVKLLVYKLSSVIPMIFLCDISIYFSRHTSKPSYCWTISNLILTARFDKKCTSGYQISHYKSMFLMTRPSCQGIVN